MRYSIQLFLFLVVCINVNAQQEIEFKDEKIGCLNLGRAQDEMIISNEEEYKEIRNFISPHPKCLTYEWPTFNFKERTLLGLLVNASGCIEPEYFKSVSTLNNEITFLVKVKETGTCRPLYQKMFWITIPKQIGTKINFKVERIK
jgi:hypothetical protein